MKFFNWMQNKFNGGQGNRKPMTASSTHHTKQEPRKEEFSDWPDGLLAIGTFGNNDLRENQESEDVPGTQSSSPDLTEFTPEEVGKLQKELTKLLSKKPSSGQTADLPLDRFLNCPSSLEVDRRISNTYCCESSNDKEEDINRTIRVILGRCKDVCMEKNKKAIGRKSVAFLLKKMFVCSSGFSPAPSLRDTLPESRMEKLLRAMLSKNMYPQNNTRSSSTKRFLEDMPMPKKGKEKDEIKEKGNDGSKWVKTDSDYIVLEI